MSKKTILFVFLFVFVLGTCVFGQSKGKGKDIRKKSADELIADFVSKNWMGKVSPAKDELESRQAEIIPLVIKLLDNEEKVELENTADLIYPGAKEFYGHGWIVDYDLDWISVRAGWLLEELTFQDFGFREGAISEEQLFNAVLSGKRDMPLKDVIGKEKDDHLKKEARNLAAKRAIEWWQSTKKPWKRFDTILDGLKGIDVALQHRIFQWLRNGDTKCDGLTLQSFDALLIPEVKRLQKSDNESISQEADLLIESNSKEKWWFRNKLKRDFPDKYTTMKLD